VGVFGGRRGIMVRARPPTDEGPSTPLRRSDRRRRQPFIDSESRLEKDENWVVCQGGQRDAFVRGTSTDLCALGRVLGLEHEGARHRRKRQVKCHIDEDRQDERALKLHDADSTHKAPVTAAARARSSVLLGHVRIHWPVRGADLRHYRQDGGAAGVACGATSCRVLPTGASYLSITYDLLGALAVLGSGVRAPSAPPLT
jgi:hypothetical protein